MKLKFHRAEELFEHQNNFFAMHLHDGKSTLEEKVQKNHLNCSSDCEVKIIFNNESHVIVWDSDLIN